MKITKGTIIRTVMLLIVLINMLLKHFGIDVIPASKTAVGEAVSAVVEILAIASAWWYNNSFTENARRADAFFEQLKEDEDV